MDWSPWRDEFPIFRRMRYLNTCSLGALAARVRAAQYTFLDEWEQYGATAWYSRWMTALEGLRTRFAKVIGADPEEVALAPSVSVALSTLASCLNYATRPKVVFSELDFPTVAYQWAVKPEVHRVVLRSPDGITVPPESYESAVDEETAALVVSHVFYTSGAIQDIARLATVAHRAGALAVVDAYQATGQLPTDVHAAGVDVLISGGLKWLLGGTGIAMVYVRRDRIADLRPTIAGWFGNRRQFDFDPARFDFWEDARRFELGTPSNAAVYACSAGIDLVLELGVPTIRRRTTELVNDLVDRLGDSGFEIRSPGEPERRAGIVMVPMADPPRAVHALADRGILVDYRHDRVRASPYFYNTPEDNQAFVDGLKVVRG
ncbi:MAG TPA: aminotransferase class V-fold PLP-dependent enzyme [Thermoplasmata archaeon]|nr:aminotransferase class V-fold PLP-dependent enzyme [Thermoplasmata archaeon]